MTLKDKVAEIEPENVSKSCGGGVLGCPKDYDYLNAVAISECYERIVSRVDCKKCWNRKFTEVAPHETTTMS